MKSVKSIYSSMHNETNDEIFLERDIATIEFNRRVLDQSNRRDFPLMERLKFIGIASNNMDEFVMVRYGEAINKFNNDNTSITQLGMAYNDLLNILKLKIDDMYHNISISHDILVDALKDEGIHFVKYKKLDSNYKSKVNKYFNEEIYPLLAPISYDSTNDPIKINNNELYMACVVEDMYEGNDMNFVIMSLNNLERVFHISDNQIDKFILTEDIVKHNLKKIFINKKVSQCATFRVIRNMDVYINSNTNVPLINRMNDTIYNRSFGDVLRVEITKGLDKNMEKLLANVLGVDRTSFTQIQSIIDLGFLLKMPKLRNRPELYFIEYKPVVPTIFTGEYDIFKLIDKSDLMLNHPYESYEPVINFIKKAAKDDNVISIRQTLYRVSGVNSPIIEALCEAAERGKEVLIILEVKARFDESQNIKMVNKLRHSGCKIIYGLEQLKTHCKFILVTKRSKKGIKQYAHIATGNYNDKTAKMYTDISYFTSDKVVTKDLVTVFNLLSGYSYPKESINKLSVAPFNIRQTLYNMIEREGKKGKEGNISIKINSLSDIGIIEALYKANNNGAKVSIICRGACSASIFDMDGNKRKRFKIRSIVGRYLEHSRIYMFGKGNCTKVFISSADMLTRNLDRRVEILMPVTNKECADQLKNYFKLLWSDNANAFNIEGLSYVKRKKKHDRIDSQLEMMKITNTSYNLKNAPIIIK